MSRLLILAVFVATSLMTGCAMIHSWRSIPPPGGCDQCHTMQISNNWTVAYQAPILTDERDRKYFQTERYTMSRDKKGTSPLEQRKVEELRCFECHKSPDQAHKGRMGRFHH